MTLKIGDRIRIEDFIEKLSTLSFQEVTKDNIKKLFEGHEELEVEEVDYNIKDISIDDYVFTIFEKSEHETCLSGYNINSTIVLEKNVTVWLPTDSKGSLDREGYGTIEKVKETFDKPQHYYLHVEYNID